MVSGFRPKPAKRAGTRPLAPGRQPRKMRALWLALYHLGEVRDPSEAALAAFAKRITGIDALQFLEPHEANAVIEGLKSWWWW